MLLTGTELKQELKLERYRLFVLFDLGGGHMAFCNQLQYCLDGHQYN